MLATITIASEQLMSTTKQSVVNQILVTWIGFHNIMFKTMAEMFVLSCYSIELAVLVGTMMVAFGSWSGFDKSDQMLHVLF